MGKKLNLDGIAVVIARDTNGYISEDLRLALIQCSEIGLGNKSYEDIIPSENRKVNYGDEYNSMSLEADVILALRFKCGDSKAMEQLFLVNKGILIECTKVKKKRETRSWDECWSDVYTAYTECVKYAAIYSEKSGTPKCYKTTYKSNFDSYILGINKAKFREKTISYLQMQIEKSQATVQTVTKEMIKEYLLKSSSYSRSKNIDSLYNEVCGLNTEVSYEALREVGDGELSDKIQEAILYHGGAVSTNPVEDTVIEKLDKKKENRIAEEIREWEKRDREVAIFCMYRRHDGEMTYKAIAEYFQLPGGIKEAKMLMMRGQRKLDKKYPGREYLDAMPD